MRSISTAMAGLLWAAAATLTVLAQPGTKLWEFATTGPIHSSPALGSDGTIYFGSRDSNVYALYPDGSKRWQYRTGGPVISSAAIGADETAYIGSLDSKLYALTTTGVLRWQFATGDGIRSSPALGVDGTLYAASLDRKLYALRPDGSLKWTYTAGAGFHSSPSLGADGTIYIGCRDKKLYALNPDGSLKWEATTTNWVESSPAIGVDGAIYVGSVDNRLYAFKPGGAKLWEMAAQGGFYGSPVVGLDGVIYIAGFDGKLYAVNADGTEHWTIKLDAAVNNSTLALTADGTICLGASDGKLYAYSSEGVKKWAFATGTNITYSSAVVGKDGTVYIGSDNGKLYAVRGTASLAAGAWPMFRRDARHTASGFVERSLPRGYSPGAVLAVTLAATPPTGITAYVVEDIPPATWQVGQISDGGYFDAINRKVKFGPFQDALPRRLTYRVTPPLGESGNKVFAGTSVADGGERLLGGQQSLDPLPLHPADQSVADGWLTVGELTGYAAAWRRGATWPSGPNPIPSAYITRAFALWAGGESYSFDPAVSLAPQWWVTNQLGPSLYPASLVLPGTTASNGWASAAMPANYLPGTNLMVELEVAPATNVLVYAVEDQPPAGWVVSQVNSNGFLDVSLGKVKWGPFFDALPRTLSYSVVAGTNGGKFHGLAAFDGVVGEIAGQRESVPVGAGLSGSVVERQLPAGYSPGAKLLVTVRAVPQTNAVSYMVEERLPGGWEVGSISHGGSFDPVNRKVKFGPFFDVQPRWLTYEVIPPLSDAGVKQLSGVFAVNGIEALVAGDVTLDWLPLHPADTQLVDGWLSLWEMTAYTAAWRGGRNWQPGPSPIPSSYVTAAINLWMLGEGYFYDPTVTNAPQWWVSRPIAPDTNSVPPVLPPAAVATNGAATASMPPTARIGSSLTVTILVAPRTNVSVCAVEDQPPPGWQVMQVSAGGFLDQPRGKVKWGPFFEATSRTVSYQVSVPAEASGSFAFNGAAAFDASAGVIGGDRVLLVQGGGGALTFVQRKLPGGYTPGARLQVSLEAGPATNTLYYLVEDQPPTNWQVGPTISHGGFFDTSSGRVRFGPFFDASPRTLTYEVRPPVEEDGLQQFVGSSVADGVESPVGGDQVFGPRRAHPADAQPIDNWLTIGEVTAYGAAWKRGADWPFPPQAIPTSYLTRAVELWLGSEYYSLDPAVTNAPTWWISVTNPPGALAPQGVAPGSTATNGTAVAAMELVARPGASLTVTISLTPRTNVAVCAVEDQPPAGWQVTQVSAGGFLDRPRGKVKWGPFFEATPRTLSYQVAVPAEASGSFAFSGAAAFDASAGEIGGERELFVQGGGSALTFVQRKLPTGYTPGALLRVSLEAVPATNTLYYLVEDEPPANWPLGSTSDGGFFDASSGRVRFGPFFDANPRTLIYTVTPPVDEDGLKQFVGLGFADGVESPVGGDQVLGPLRAHPADARPIDNWLTIGEVTAYGAAWKRGADWPFPPRPIPTSYLTRAIALWQGSGYYGLDLSITNAPAWWVSLPVPPEVQPPIGVAPGSTATNGAAVADLPKMFQPGVAVPVSLTVTPATNVLVYAVEDQPPVGWLVSDLSAGGRFDLSLGKVKWGPFFDATARTFTYRATPPVDAAATAAFSGGAAFDGLTEAFGGRRQVVPASASVPVFTSVRYLPARGVELMLEGVAGEAYVIEASSTLGAWKPLATLTNRTGTLQWTDSAATNLVRRFYRALWP